MTKEQDFKIRFATVLQDFQQNGTKDPEIMWLTGTLASDLADDLKSASWSAAKSVMNKQTFDNLLKVFETRGTEHHHEGREKHAYAIQLLAVSLIAGTQRSDPEMAAGEQLLDHVIDSAVAVHRQAKQAKAN
jgi:hypothetical protein